MPTKFYFSSSDIARVNPPFSGNVSGWNGTTGATRYMMYPFKKNTSIATGNTINLNDAASSFHLDRQYISQPLNQSGVVSGLCSGFLMVREYATQDNVERICCCLRVFDYKCTGQRGIVVKLSGFGTTAEFVNAVTHRNKVILSGVLTNRITGQRGDRLVLEIGYTSTVGGTTSQASAIWGDAAADLPMNETQTTFGAGWFSINCNLSFKTGNYFSSFS